METVVPQYRLEAFNCPHCGAYAHMTWWNLRYENAGFSILEGALCMKCDEPSFWRRDQRRMVDPLSTTAPRPAADMPEDVRKDYEEAAAVFGVSPRAAAALLRLALQKLCVHLGEKGDKIDTDIRELAKKGVLPQLLINVADTVRITGNNAVHPGEMDAADVDLVASKMFKMLNLIVHKGITEPAELKALYELVPEGARAAAEEKDARARADN
ncbi:DUF4145 domain-containing protein [Pseudomonas defluvii]|uniref:DUF4145 domain-containing protein n=1 Tax=Pseudomonas defluvii TaxID=1876757 RepID=UPI0008113BDF|nr:DUF4145 domain-containing protein [Pseudomonas defluvii]